MRPIALHLTHAVLGLLIGLGMLPLAAYADPPTPTLAPLNNVQLRVLLRTPTGQPVPGIVVDLTPAAPELGGPPADTPAQTGQTDATGAVLFAGVQGAIWRVTFMGHYAGQALQPVANQGQPPYGTTHGGGFVVQTSLHEENDAPAPVVEVAAPPVETLSFILLSVGGSWMPAIDLAPPTDPPQPLSQLAQAPARVTFYVPVPQPPAGDPSPSAPPLADDPRSTPDGGFAGLWLVPTFAAGAALWRVWQARGKREHSGRARRDSANVEYGKGTE